MNDYKVQSVLFNRKYFTLEKAVNFLANKNLKHTKVDKTENYWRFRQINPAELRAKGYTHYVNKEITQGLYLVLAYRN